MSKMKLGVKIALGFALLLVITIVLGGIAFWNMIDVSSQSDILAFEYAPEVSVANNIERNSLLAMYANRAYSYTEDEQFLKTGQERLEKACLFLAEAEQLANEAKHLEELKGQVSIAKKEIKNYQDLLQQTITKNQRLAELRKQMDESSAIFMKNCFSFLEHQNVAMIKEFDQEASPLQLKERLTKITLVNNIIDKGNAARLGNYKSQALRKPDVMREALKNFEDMEEDFVLLRSITKLSTTLEQIEATKNAGEQYKQAMDAFLTTWFERETLNQKRGAAADQVLEAAQKTAESGIGQTLKIAEQAASDLSNASTVILIGICVALVVGALLALFITRSITRPISEVMKSARNIQQGDLSKRLHSKRADEVGQLANTFDEMADILQAKALLAEAIATGDLTKDVELASDLDTLGRALSIMSEGLNEVIGQINEAVSQVALGSGQVSDSSQSLSQGATEQAASIEEITSSMMELASQTKNNAENATQANQLSISARDSASTGNDQMLEMISAMNEINDSSKEIAKIIKTIDDIAFQTNLLALNAAVEAARAGKHGKGFAVVAQEVRNLAGRSAKAAKETAELIDGSVKKVEKGTEIVDRTAQSLKEIVEGTTKVTDLVGEIAAASNEQAQGITQVNQGMSQVEQVTQQNTANAEETAAAAEELSSQADQLNHLVSRFKLKGQEKELTGEPKVVNAKALKQLTQATPPNKWGGDMDSSGWKNKSVKPDDLISLDDKDFGKF